MTEAEFTQIAILDTETTGLRHVTRGGTGRVIQYGLVVLELPTLRYVTHREALVNLDACRAFDWEQPDVQDALAVNHLEPAFMRAHGIPAREALGHALSIDWRGTCLAAWGLEFDLAMVEGEHKHLGISGVPWHYRALDIRSLCAGEQMRDAVVRGSSFHYLGCHDWIVGARGAGRAPEDLEHLMQGRCEHNALYDAAMAALALRVYCGRERR